MSMLSTPEEMAWAEIHAYNDLKSVTKKSLCTREVQALLLQKAQALQALAQKNGGMCDIVYERFVQAVLSLTRNACANATMSNDDTQNGTGGAEPTA